MKTGWRVGFSPREASASLGGGAEAPRGLKPTLRLLAILFALARTAVCANRAAQQSLTIDEAFSYNDFISGPWSRIWGRYDANNHILYSILAKLSVRAFHLSEFALRLPSLLAGLFLVLGIYWVLEAAGTSPVVRWVALIALSLHPLMLDLSIAARGYSLGLALLVWAVYFFMQGREVLPGALLGLGIAANLTIVYPAAGLVVCPLFLRPGTHGNRLRSSLVLGTAAAAVAGAICFGALSHAAANNFYAGDPDFRIALLTLIDASIRGYQTQVGLFGNWYAARAILVWFLPLVTIFVLAVSAVAFFRAPSRRLALTPTVMLVAAILELIAAHYAVGLNYPIDRLGLYLVLLFGLAWAFAASQVRNIPARAVNGILAGLLTIQFAAQFDSRYFQLWPQDLPAKQVARRIREETRGLAPGSVKVSATWFQQPALEFYRRYYSISALAPIERQDKTPLEGFDYYVLNLKDDASIRAGNVGRLQALLAEPVSGVLLAREPR